MGEEAGLLRGITLFKRFPRRPKNDMILFVEEIMDSILAG
jgi:hypothetical protein